MRMILIFYDFMKIGWRGVVGLPMRCTKMDQNGHHIMTEQKCFEFVLSDLNDRFSGLNGHLKGDRSQYKSWRGHRVTHKMHQNAPKCIKTDQNRPKLWCILVHFMCEPMTPPWLVLTPIPFQESILSRKRSY